MVGGQHACAIARSLNIKQVFIHKYAGILSAYGIALADVVHEEIIPCSLQYDVSNLDQINSKIDSLIRKCNLVLTKKGFSQEYIKYEIYLNLRYEKTDFALMVACEEVNVYCNETNYIDCFRQQYKREFGFTISDRAILVDDVRVRGIGFIKDNFLSNLSSHQSCNGTTAKIIDYTQCYFENVGFVEIPIYMFDNLSYGHMINGPAMIIESNNTILIEPLCRANVTQQGNILIDVECVNISKLTPALDPIYLSIFSHIFMSIAEQMGCVLQHTAISTNIKERLDFSCAIFGPSGHLVKFIFNLKFVSKLTYFKFFY